MKKVVLSLDLHDDKAKQRAMKTVSGLTGVESISMDMKDKKLTVIGDIDPIDVVSKLRKKQWRTEILSVGPPKEPEKKKEEPKKEEDKKKDQNEQIQDFLKAYNPYMTTHYYVPSAEEDPNACVIC